MAVGPKEGPKPHKKWDFTPKWGPKPHKSGIFTHFGPGSKQTPMGRYTHTHQWGGTHPPHTNGEVHTSPTNGRTNPPLGGKPTNGRANPPMGRVHPCISGGFGQNGKMSRKWRFYHKMVVFPPNWVFYQMVVFPPNWVFYQRGVHCTHGVSTKGVHCTHGVSTKGCTNHIWCKLTTFGVKPHFGAN